MTRFHPKRTTLWRQGLYLPCLLRFDSAAEGLFYGVMGFIGQHSFPGAEGTFPFLSAALLNPGAFRRNCALLKGFDFIQQQLAGEKTVEGLLPGRLALDLKARGTVQEHDTG